jgi:hypothetical protein
VLQEGVEVVAEECYKQNGEGFEAGSELWNEFVTGI